MNCRGPDSAALTRYHVGSISEGESHILDCAVEIVHFSMRTCKVVIKHRISRVPGQAVFEDLFRLLVVAYIRSESMERIVEKYRTLFFDHGSHSKFKRIAAVLVVEFATCELSGAIKNRKLDFVDNLSSVWFLRMKSKFRCCPVSLLAR